MGQAHTVIIFITIATANQCFSGSSLVVSQVTCVKLRNEVVICQYSYDESEYRVGRPLWIVLLLPQIPNIPLCMCIYRLLWDKTFMSNRLSYSTHIKHNDIGTYAHIPATALVTKAVVNLQLCLPNKSASKHSGTVAVLHISTQGKPGCSNHDWHTLTTLTEALHQFPNPTVPSLGHDHFQILSLSLQIILLYNELQIQTAS
jgi:hypothetical protein